MCTVCVLCVYCAKYGVLYHIAYWMVYCTMYIAYWMYVRIVCYRPAHILCACGALYSECTSRVQWPSLSKTWRPLECLYSVLRAYMVYGIVCARDLSTCVRVYLPSSCTVPELHFIPMCRVCLQSVACSFSRTPHGCITLTQWQWSWRARSRGQRPLKWSKRIGKFSSFIQYVPHALHTSVLV